MLSLGKFFLNLSSVYKRLSKAQEVSMNYNSVKAVSVVGKATAQNNLKTSPGLLNSHTPSSKDHTQQGSQPSGS